ncbi:sialate O-acetylesterase [Nitrospirota bacterium]
MNKQRLSRLFYLPVLCATFIIFLLHPNIAAGKGGAPNKDKKAGDISTHEVNTPVHEQIDCASISSKRLMVALILGQSNVANTAPSLSSASGNVFILYKGKCFHAKDPLLGTSGKGGSVWPLLGDMLISENIYDNVLFIPIAIGGSRVRDWAPEGYLHDRLIKTLERIRSSGFRETHILWHQGESDSIKETSKDSYVKSFNEMVQSIRSQDVEAPLFVSVASVCRNEPSLEIRGAQKEVLNKEMNILPGPDTDELGPRYRKDGCHFNTEGIKAFASLWLQLISAYKTEHNNSSGQRQ